MKNEFNDMLTDSQIKRRVQAKAKRWLKEKGYMDVQINCIRGTFHVSNASKYMMSAKYILESSTGLNFNYMNDSMTRLSKEPQNPAHNDRRTI